MARRLLTGLVMIVLILFGGFLGYHMARRRPATPNSFRPLPAVAAPASATSAARGAQLVLLGGCNDCHTTKLLNGQPNMAYMLSGYQPGSPLPPTIPGVITGNPQLTAWRGPWGLTLAMNITPDKQTGIGKWTLAQFIHTMRTGVDPNGHALLPPMNYQNLGRLPDTDLAAIYNYLMSIKPIHNLVHN